jgi:hypothetical protein
MKYIMLEVDSDTPTARRLPILFPVELIHSDVADALIEVVKNSGNSNVKPVSAGEVILESVKTGGFSSSLHIGPEPLDSATIAYHDSTSGLVALVQVLYKEGSSS